MLHSRSGPVSSVSSVRDVALRSVSSVRDLAACMSSLTLITLLVWFKRPCTVCPPSCCGKGGGFNEVYQNRVRFCPAEALHLEPQKLKNKQCNIKLNNSPHIFHLREYISNLPERTKWVADTVPEMVNLITQIKNGPRDRPKVTTKNFVLQELEAISREEKHNEAIRLGQIPLSLQHDGVVLGRTIRWDEESLKKYSN